MEEKITHGSSPDPEQQPSQTLQSLTENVPPVSNAPSEIEDGEVVPEDDQVSERKQRGGSQSVDYNALDYEGAGSDDEQRIKSHKISSTTPPIKEEAQMSSAPGPISKY